jgi:hypothetical protein
VRVWDLGTGRQHGDPLTGHTGLVRAVATTTLPDGRSVAVTGGEDGTVRVWDLDTGRQHGDPLTGRTGRVLAVATITLPDGRPAAVTGGIDGTVRVWDLDTGRQHGDPLTGHTNWVLAVATITLPDGRPVAVTGGDDGTVRVWDLGTGRQHGDPLTGHTGLVLAVATTTLPDGRPVAVTGGTDGTVRVWDLTSGSPMVVVPVHPGGVTCAAFTDLPDAGRVVLTGGTDGVLRAWAMSALLEARAIGLDEVFAGENTGASDRLSRAGLASHVAERLHQLTSGDRSPSPAAGDLTGSGIVHLDGRWGAGKTTLVELMLRERAADLGRPVVVRYDAWRQAAIAPEWWSVAAEVRRAIHGSRAAPTRVVLTLAGFARRLGRSTSTWVALLVVAAAGAAGRWLITEPSGLSQQFAAVLGLLSSLSGLLAIAFVLARGLFWSAPVLGRLHVRSDDNPLGEISGIVGHLRRWSPREGVPQRLIDWMFTGWLALTVSMAMWWRQSATLWRTLPTEVRDHVIRAVTVAVALAVFVAWFRLRHRPGPRGTAASSAPRRRRLPGGLRTRWDSVKTALVRARQQWNGGPHRRRQAIGRLARRLLSVVIGLAALAVTGWVSLPLWSLGQAWWSGSYDPTTRRWILAGVAGIAVYLALLAATSVRQRRMVLLVIDDLDRCTGERVVRLLETVHTMLRERVGPRRLRRWREPAPFAVIVLASGAWIRAAFATHYETFDRKADADTVHDLGADFLQKIFDHSVLIPGLSPEQTERLIHVISGSSYHAPRHGTRPLRIALTDKMPDPRHSDRDAKNPKSHDLDTRTDVDAGPPTLPPASRETLTAPTTSPVPEAASQPPPSDAENNRRRDAERAAVHTQAARSDLGVNAQLLITHLLTDFSTVLPGNPRLIIRVASAWAMLRAVARSLDLEVEPEPANELLVRAAVIWVRFPVLVDELLDADQPPIIDPTDPECPPKWRRRDVQQVLTMKDGRRLDIEDLALYYGKFYAPQAPAPAVKPDPQVALANPAPGANGATPAVNSDHAASWNQPATTPQARTTK